MGDVAKATGKFFARDLLYVLSGLYILTTLGQFVDPIGIPKIDRFDLLKSDATRLILVLGSAYVLGFVVKELFAYLRITVEAHYFTPSWLDELLYRRHEGKKWVQPPEFNVHEAYRRLQAAGDVSISKYDRISNVVHVLSITGTSLVFCGSLLFLHFPLKAICDSLRAAGLNACVGVALIVVGMGIIEMSRFHSMRRLLALSRLYEQHVDAPGAPTERRRQPAIIDSNDRDK